jgi:hypothetical protein
LCTASIKGSVLLFKRRETGPSPPKPRPDPHRPSHPALTPVDSPKRSQARKRPRAGRCFFQLGVRFPPRIRASRPHFARGEKASPTRCGGGKFDHPHVFTGDASSPLSNRDRDNRERRGVSMQPVVQFRARSNMFSAERSGAELMSSSLLESSGPCFMEMADKF